MLATKLLIPALLLLQTIAAASDRPAAEWVLRMNGSIVVEGDPKPIWDVAKLPSKDFHIAIVNLTDSWIEPADLKILSGLTHLKELYLSGRTWHSRPTSLANASFAALGSLTSLEKLALSLPVQTDTPCHDPALEILRLNGKTEGQLFEAGQTAEGGERCV